MPRILEYKGKLPDVADDAYLADDVTLVGDVTIGAESSIWFGAVLRGDVLPIRIGERTSIQDNSVVHTSRGRVPTVVGDDVTVGHMVLLHGCTVHDRVIVGMGSILLDGAELGPDSILGAGSLVTENARIPSGVLALGRPAKPVRDLREAELRAIRESAEAYVHKCRDYLSLP